MTILRAARGRMREWERMLLEVKTRVECFFEVHVESELRTLRKERLPHIELL